MKKLLLVLLFLPLCGCSNRLVRMDPAEQLPQLVVHGEARLQVPPDQLQLRLGVLTAAGDAETALAENSRRMQGLLAALQQQGLEEGEYRTGQFSIRPDWSQPPRPIPAGWQRRIIGYRVNNQLLVRTGRIDLAGKLLAVAQQAGANQLDNLSFTLAEPAAHRQRAIALATEQAVRKARSLATAAGVELGGLQSLRLDQAGPPGPVAQLGLQVRPARLTAESVPISAGEVEVRSGVTLVYRLKKR